MSQIIQCSHCGAKNRLAANVSPLNARCGRCHRAFVTEIKNTSFWAFGARKIPIAFWIATWILLGLGAIFVPDMIARDSSKLWDSHQQRIELLENELNEKLLNIKQNFGEQLNNINPAELASQSRTAYQEEFRARSSFDQRFALSQRERTQLRLKSMASDTSQSIQDVLRAVALEAAPNGSTANVRQTQQGLLLNIEFDMGSMVAGEATARTRHQTLDSLKREVISLISRVTNDVFLVCRDFPIYEIQVGCLRTVFTDNSRRTTRKLLLYQINIRAESFSTKSNNPFLDFYATAENMNVLTDNFSTLQLIDMR